MRSLPAHLLVLYSIRASQIHTQIHTRTHNWSNDEMYKKKTNKIQKNKKQKPKTINKQNVDGEQLEIVRFAVNCVQPHFVVNRISISISVHILANAHSNVRFVQSDSRNDRRWIFTNEFTQVSHKIAHFIYHPTSLLPILTPFITATTTKTKLVLSGPSVALMLP